ncbi:MAG: hypothetical protein AB7E80_11200 [Hyphomicrobiaceae bacterium]
MATVEQIMDDALRSAAEYRAAVAQRERDYRFERMSDAVRAIGDRLDEDDSAFLDVLGLESLRRDDRLVLRKAGWIYEIAPTDDLTLMVNGTEVKLDRQFPVLTAELYELIKGSIARWAEAIDDGTAREVRR